jgi:hypothetical protein
MREHQYLQCLHFNSLRLPSGAVVNMSLPIVLAVDDADKDRVGAAPDVALAGPDGELVAVLRRFAPFHPSASACLPVFHFDMAKFFPCFLGVKI